MNRDEFLAEFRKNVRELHGKYPKKFIIIQLKHGSCPFSGNCCDDGCIDNTWIETIRRKCPISPKWQRQVYFFHRARRHPATFVNLCSDMIKIVKRMRCWED
jgi:hypothetical protein